MTAKSLTYVCLFHFIFLMLEPIRKSHYSQETRCTDLHLFLHFHWNCAIDHPRCTTVSVDRARGDLGTVRTR